MAEGRDAGELIDCVGSFTIRTIWEELISRHMEYGRAGGVAALYYF